MIDGIRRSVDKRTCTAFVPTPPEPVFCTENERCRGCPYSTIGSSEYESQRLRHLFTAAAPMAEIDAELLKSAVSQIYVKKGQTSLLLKNGQIIERSA